MGRISTCGFNEDLDLNAGAATIAVIGAGQLLVSKHDADTIKLPNTKGMELRAIRWHDETAGGTGGSLALPGYNAERKVRFGKDTLTGDLLTGEIIYPPGVFKLPPSQKISCIGNASGSGAEQHTVLLDIYYPDLPDVPMLGQGQGGLAMLVGKLTGTLVANSLTGMSDIISGFQDSETPLAETEENKYAITRLGAFPSGAGYGILGLRHQDGKSDLLFPAMITAVKGNYYPIGWLFSGDSPPKTIGCGVGTTSSEMILEILTL